MKVNFLTGSLMLRKHRTGVHLFYENLVNEIKKCNKDWDLKVSCYSSEKEISNQFPEYREESYYKNLFFSSKIVRIISYFLPIEFFFGTSDIYICDGLIPLTLKRSCKVAVIFDLMVKIYPQNYSKLKKMYLNFFYKRCQKADCIIAASETTKKDIVRFLKIDESKIRVIDLGFSFKTQGTIDKQSTEQDNMLNKKYMFYIGDMRANKNLLNAIKGIQIAIKKCPQLCFYIAGAKTNEYAKLYSYVLEHGLDSNVFFLGYVSETEKYQLYSNANGFLFVSNYEGFGLPILEAAACEVPVITSDCSSMKEIAEGSSILVNPHSPNEIAEAIDKLNDKIFRQKVVNKQKILLQKYTWSNTYLQFTEVINNIEGWTKNGELYNKNCFNFK